MLFIGHTRFSLFHPKSSSWQATTGRFKTPEEYREYLFSDERLAPRVEVFVGQSLPQLAEAARWHSLRHVVSYSDTLPEKWQEALETAARRYPFLVLDRQTPGHPAVDLTELARESLVESHGDWRHRTWGQFRLDDDDLLPTDYFERMAAYVRPENAGMLVSLGSGLTALRTGTSYTNVREAHWPMIAIGLMRLCRFDPDGTVVEPAPAPHNMVDRVNPVILDSRGHGWFWARSADQDTALRFGAGEARARVLAEMQRYPVPADEKSALSGFPVLQGLVGAGRAVPVVREPLPLPPDGVRVETPGVSGDFDFSAALDCGAGVPPNSALLALHLEGDAAALTPEALKATGIHHSATVGPYRYLPTAPGASRFDTAFTLPPGVRCEAVTLRKWGRTNTEITVRSATLTHR